MQISQFEQTNQYYVQLREQSVDFFKNLNLSTFWSVAVQSVSVVLSLLLVAWLVDRVITLIMRRLSTNLTQKTKNKWDDILLKNKVFANTAHFFPGFVFLLFDSIIASRHIRFFIDNMMATYFIIVALLLINSLLNSVYEIYERYNEERAKEINLKIYLQLLKVVLFSLGVIAIFSIYANKNFKEILTGLGAMLTILLIVYKDTILGFVAGMQLSANKMVKVGDWVAIPQHNTDGTVIDISLNTVKVQNWDKTITTVPTYRLISESFTNWVGMQESGGRRIKRHIYIDLDSIHFLNLEEINRLREMQLISDYINNKLNEINTANKHVERHVNQRKLTNIGTFRKYIECYVKNTGFVNEEYTFLVRQLQSTEKGVPIEIYMFCNEQQWATYEQIQADIFDHIFAIVSEFNLRIFQSPTGSSFSSLGKANQGS